MQFWRSHTVLSQFQRFVLEEVLVRNARVYVDKSKVALNENRKIKLFEFSYSKHMANFETILWIFSSSANPETVRSDIKK